MSYIPAFIALNKVLFTPVLQDYIVIVLLFLIFFVNVFVSASEVAILSIWQNDSDVEDSPKIPKPERLLLSIMLTYNMLNVSFVGLSIFLFKRHFDIDILSLNTVLFFIILILFVVIFMETIPKQYVLQKSPSNFLNNNISRIKLIDSIASPLSSFLERSTSIVKNRMSFKRKSDLSMDDLSRALKLTSDQGNSNPENDMLEGIIRFYDKTVDQIMISRIDMVSIKIETDFDKLKDIIVEAGYSRIPVYEESRDNIKGILYVKDLLPHLSKQKEFRWQSFIRPAFFVPGTKRIEQLLEEFRANKNHMAIVVDEYGGTSGIVTLEDILEEIIGEISDEYDHEPDMYVKMPDGSYLVEGKMPISEFFHVVGIPSDEFSKYENEVDTVAGLVLEIKGFFPNKNETIRYKNYKFLISEMNKRRILKIKFSMSDSEK